MSPFSVSRCTGVNFSSGHCLVREKNTRGCLEGKLGSNRRRGGESGRSSGIYRNSCLFRILIRGFLRIFIRNFMGKFAIDQLCDFNNFSFNLPRVHFHEIVRFPNIQFYYLAILCKLFRIWNFEIYIQFWNFPNFSN